MNKIFRFLTVAVAAVCTFSLAACGDDDDDDEKQNSASEGAQTSVTEVSGNTWVLNTSKSTAYAAINGIEGETDLSSSEGNGVIPTLFTFNADGTADVEVEDTKSTGKYSINGKEFSCSYNIVITKTENGVSSPVETPFTLEKDADLTKTAWELLGEDSDLSQSVFTTCQLTKSGDQLILNLTLTTTFNTDAFDFSDSELSDSYKSLINNTLNSEKYVKYHLVYDKK